MSAAPTSIDLVRYPIDQPGTTEFDALVEQCRRTFLADDMVLLPGFLTDRGLDALAEEASELLPKAFFCRNDHNVYLDASDPSLPDVHPRNQMLRTSVGSIANDYLDPTGPLVSMYRWPHLTQFIAAVVSADELHCSVDPMGAVSVNVFAAGDAHEWHFDESRFSVTIMVQPADGGGHFEYVTGLRPSGGHDDDGNTAAIRQLLGGDERHVERLDFEPGTLSIFGGRHTIHRVTEVVGTTPRLVPVLTYSTEPNYRNSDEVRRLFWGRAT